MGVAVRVSAAKLRLAVVMIALTVVGGLGLPAKAVSGIAGSCEFVGLQLGYSNGNTTIQSSGGVCAFNSVGLVGLTSNAATTGTIEIFSSNIAVTCSNANTVRTVNGTVRFTARPNGGTRQTFENVSFILESGGTSGSATLMLKGLEFAGSGLFLQNGGSCASRNATWSFGHLSFEDPTL